jgi:hypothetical protein
MSNKSNVARSMKTNVNDIAFAQRFYTFRAVSGHCLSDQVPSSAFDPHCLKDTPRVYNNGGQRDCHSLLNVNPGS